MIYALGRGLDPADQPAIREIARQTAQNDYRISSLVLGDRQQRPVPANEKETEPPMIVTSKHLPRRTFLRGVGAALALPMLDSMIPALAVLRGREKRPRACLFTYIPGRREHDLLDAAAVRAAIISSRAS